MQHVVLINPDGTSAEGVGDTDGGVEVEVWTAEARP